MIVVTGASGFIGSMLIKALNHTGYTKEIVAVDDFYKDFKDVNLKDARIREWVHRSIFLKWFEKFGKYVSVVDHLGARTDTMEYQTSVFDKLNVGFTKSTIALAQRYNVPIIYASSASVYGDGSAGFNDELQDISSYLPLNPYAKSKWQIDNWVLQGDIPTPDYWVGFRFFNVYGPQEWHKKKMASVVFHAYNQLLKDNRIKLFRSYHEAYKDGLQLRDFIYVKDIVNVLIYVIEHKIDNGIYNLGTGEPRSFLDLAQSVIKYTKPKATIEFIDMPEHLKPGYQYFTEAKMDKLKAQMPDLSFTPLEDGIADYISHLKVNSSRKL